MSRRFIRSGKQLLRLMGMASSAGLHGIIDYLDKKEFDHVQANHSLRKWEKPDGCVVAAFTGFDDPDAPSVYINREFATPATLIHELLHLLTHPQFHKHFGRAQPGFVEGMTEYFTRAVQGNTTATKHKPFRKFCKEYSPRTGHYDEELGKVNLIDRQSLSKIGPTRGHPKGEPMLDVMEQAYFNGHPKAIEILSKAKVNPFFREDED